MNLPTTLTFSKLTCFLHSRLCHLVDYMVSPTVVCMSFCFIFLLATIFRLCFPFILATMFRPCFRFLLNCLVDFKACLLVHCTIFVISLCFLGLWRWPFCNLPPFFFLCLWLYFMPSRRLENLWKKKKKSRKNYK